MSIWQFYIICKLIYELGVVAGQPWVPTSFLKFLFRKPDSDFCNDPGLLCVHYGCWLLVALALPAVH